MPRRLTPQSTLDNLRKEAKRWLRALRDNVADARTRLERALPDAPRVPALRDIQHALAREHGLTGWAALKELLGKRPPAARPDDIVNRFLENACPDHHVRGGPAHVRARHTAMRLLAHEPGLAHASLATEIVCGDIAAVEAAIAERPELARLRTSDPDARRSGTGSGDGRWLQGDLDRDLGAKGWEPLLYLCFARMDRAASNDNALDIAGALLDRGADPNAFFMAGDSRYTPLVGAIGEGEEDRPPHPRRDELVRLLLDRGAEPFDIQVVYNIHFHGQVLWFLELIHEHSVRLGRQSAWDDPEWPMLDMGGYGSGARWHLWIAIKKNDVALAEWCLAHGANPDAAPARAKHLPKSSLYEVAVRRGCAEIAELLVRYGAPRVEVSLTPIERFGIATSRLDREGATAELGAHPELRADPGVLLSAAQEGRIDVVRLLLDLGFSVDAENAVGERALHMAAYGNQPAVAQQLIDRGAEIDPVEANWHNTPLAAAIYGQHHAMIELLGRYSRDVWELVYSGRVERVRELVAEQPALARTAGNGHTLLMWLPPQDEALALELARLLLRYGADATLRNNEGQTAADRAEAQGMLDVAAALRQAEKPAPDRPTLERFERMAENLLEAYRSGTPEAMERHYAETWHRRVWPAMRRYTLLDLGRVPAPDDAFIDISLDDARLIVANEQQFESWEALAEYTRSLPAAKKMLVARPVAVFAGRGYDSASRREVMRDWETVIELARTGTFNGVEAQGQMSDVALDALSGAESITTLHLGGSKELTDEGVRHLARMPQLRHLDLSGTSVTDRGLEALRGLVALESISLSGTRVTDAGVAHLSGCEQLQRVDLGWTRSGDGAIRALAGKDLLRTFSSGHGVTDAGISLLHEFPVFKTWRESAIAPSADMDGGPNSLMLRGPFTDRGLANLVGLDGLFGLNIWDINLAITAAGLAPLANLPNLGRLAVEAHDDTMPYLAALPHLRFLMIQDTDASDDGWVALSKSQSIEQIWGRRCHNLRSRGFVALSQMAALRGLAVSCLNVDDAAIATLPEFPALRQLTPMDIPDAGYRHIGRCEQLDELTLMYCRDTGDEATGHITGLAHLRRYFASYTQATDRTPELLSTMTSLEEIEFSGCAKITDRGIVALAKLPRLRELRLGRTPTMSSELLGAFGPQVTVRHGG